MAKLFDMYKGTDTPDIYNQVKSSRQESEANSKKTTDTAFGMLKKSNVGTLQQEYRAGTSRFKGITDPDKKFQVYYDALKALDPQAAQDAAKVYGEERQRRINREIADAYKTKGSTGNPELDAIDKAIAELEASMTVSAANTASEAVIEEQAPVEQTETTVAPAVATPTETAVINSEAAGKASANMSGYTPSRLQDFYNSTDRKMPSLDMGTGVAGVMYEQIEPPFSDPRIKTPGNVMEEYLPMSRYNNYQPETRRLATMYRGI